MTKTPNSYDMKCPRPSNSLYRHKLVMTTWTLGLLVWIINSADILESPLDDVLWSKRLVLMGGSCQSGANLLLCVCNEKEEWTKLPMGVQGHAQIWFYTTYHMMWIMPIKDLHHWVTYCLTSHCFHATSNCYKICREQWWAALDFYHYQSKQQCWMPSG